MFFKLKFEFIFCSWDGSFVSFLPLPPAPVTMDFYLGSNLLLLHRDLCMEERYNKTKTFIKSHLVLSSVSTGRDFPRDLLGQTGTRRHFVPRQKEILSRRPFVPGQGQEQKSRDNLLCPGTSRDKSIKNFHKKDQISCSRTSFSCFRTSFSCLRT